MDRSGQTAGLPGEEHQPDQRGQAAGDGAVRPAFADFMAELKAQGEANADGCLFCDRASLPSHVRAEIRRACRALGIQPLGSHGLRKLNAQAMYAALREQGLDDEAARLEVARHLGHNRVRVTVQSYVEAQRQRG